MANGGTIDVPVECFFVTRFDPAVRIVSGRMGYPTESWARGFVSDILQRLALENTIHAEASECNMILGLLPSGQTPLVVVRSIPAGGRLLVHGCPRCEKEFHYKGTSPQDCDSIFTNKGHSLVCPKCG